MGEFEDVRSKECKAAASDYKLAMSDVLNKANLFSTRLGVLAAMLRGLDVSNLGAAVSYTARAAPYIPAISPARNTIDAHVGKSNTPVARLPAAVEAFTPRKRSSRTTASPTAATSTTSLAASVTSEVSESTQPGHSARRNVGALDSFVIRQKPRVADSSSSSPGAGASDGTPFVPRSRRKNKPAVTLPPMLEDSKVSLSL